MDYNSKLWNDYTDDNKFSEVNPSQFIYHTALALGAESILEAGCNVGNNLKDFPRTFNVHGFDMNEYAINECKKKYPEFKFKIGSINHIPFPDLSFDLVFTRSILIHIQDIELKEAMNELLRVAKRWIINLEYFGEKEEMINWKRGKNLLWYRNMKKRWNDFNVRVLTDKELPTDLDPAKTRFTLVEKLF